MHIAMPAPSRAACNCPIPFLLIQKSWQEFTWRLGKPFPSLVNLDIAYTAQVTVLSFIVKIHSTAWHVSGLCVGQAQRRPDGHRSTDRSGKPAGRDRHASRDGHPPPALRRRRTRSAGVRV